MVGPLAKPGHAVAARSLTLLAVLLLVAQPVLAAPDSSLAPSPATDLPEPQRLATDPVEQLLALPTLQGDQRTLAELTLFGQQPGLSGTIFPPDFVYRGVDTVCDVNGDGVNDLVSNDLTLRRNGRFDSGFSFIRTLSGADGSQLWSANNLFYANLGLTGAFTTVRSGQASPQSPPNVVAMPDVDGDGACDVFAYGLESRGIVEPFLIGNPSVSAYDITVRVLSGRTGEPVWSTIISAANADYSMPLFGWTTGNAILGFPTGFSVFDTPEGARFVLKTTDLVYNYVADPTALTGIVTGDRDGLYLAHVLSAEHVILGDAATGATLWKRDFGADASCFTTISQTDPQLPDPSCAQQAVPQPDQATPSQPDHINITWISGLGDMDGDGTLDIVLDQLMLVNPRTSTVVNPVSGEKVFRYGRGMRMLAIDGVDGSDLWSSIILDPLAVQVRPADETNQEILLWTYGRVLPDMDGDGRAEPIAEYLAQEMVGATPNGRFRTHFLRLAPADGVILWDHPQQGWGTIAALSADRMALGTLDLPTGIRGADGRFPAKALRISGVKAATGQTEWSYEERWGLDSSSSYELGLQQLYQALAPVDITGDGVREVVTPSRYVAPENTSQVFLSTARQDFLVLDGKTGATRTKLDLWGPSGLLLPCVEDGVLTFAVGHGRRMDLVRVDARTGEQVARQNIYSFSEPRSALVGIDVISADGKCALHNGKLTYAVNLEAFSFFRRYEIIALVGVLDQDGSPLWQSPKITEEAPTPSILETASTPPSLLPAGAGFVLVALAATAAGLGLGALVGLPAGRALARRKVRLDPLGLALLVLVVPSVAFSHLPEPTAAGPALPDLGQADLEDLPGPLVTGAAPGQEGSPAAAAAPSSASAALDTDADDDGFDAAALVSAWSYAQLDARRGLPVGGRTADVSDRYDENETITFPHILGDMDGDGVDDVALDVYCSSFSFTSCLDPSYDLLDQPAAAATTLFAASVCGPHHQLVVVSGASGDRLWDVPMDTPIPLPTVLLRPACAAEAVVGIVPLPDGSSGILVYRFEAIDAGEAIVGGVFNHTLFLRDGATGSPLWSFNEKGYGTPPSLFGIPAQTVAVSMLLDPTLVLTDTRTPDRSNRAQPGLMVRGIGYRSSSVDDQGLVSGLANLPFSPVRVADTYDPLEWIASLDPVSGQVLWRVDSFQPVPNRSVLPLAPRDSYFRDEYGDREYHGHYSGFDFPSAVTRNAWSDDVCCGDLTGDGVFDPVFTTLEWFPLPNANTGPQKLDANLVAFDGATGARLWVSELAKDQPIQIQQTPYYWYPSDTLQMRLQAVGDTNADGAADVLVHVGTRDADYHSSSRLFDGKTGALAWKTELPQAQVALAVGDANGDGGNDLLFLDWFQFEMYREIQGDYTNATMNPLLMRSGATGQVLYTTATYSAPIDMITAFANLQRSGLPDIDHDGVGDYPVDDPVFLPDQIQLHQLRYLSGRDGHRLFTIPVAGAFAFSARLPDLDGDGNDELAVLSGDAQDLWMSYRDGKDGHSLWGHRAMAVRTADYVLAIPKMEFLPMTTGFGDHDVGFLSDLHMDTEEITGEYESVNIDTNGAPTNIRGLYTETTTLPQLNVVLDATGMDTWSYPSGGDIAQSRVDGESPGTHELLGIRSVAEPTAASLATRFVHDGWIPMVGFGAGLLVAFVLVAILVRRKGVPA